MIDYMKQMEHLGANMTPQEKTDALFNGAWNAISEILTIVQNLEQRVKELEKQNAQSRTMG
jgi:hypothetical protein